MDKRRLFIYLISIFLFLFLFDSKVVVAKETEILQYPVASDIYYGQPLFSSKLNGGIASVDGEFYWKNDDLVLDVGHHQEIVVFLPKNKEYECIEFDVAITVYKRRVYIEFEKKLTKLYDGNDSIEIPGYYIRGIVDDDVYVSGDIIAKLDSVFAGENVGVNISGLEIKGKNKDNYYLDLTGVVADVYKKHIEI